MKELSYDMKKCLERAELLAAQSGNVMDTVHVLIAMTEDRACYGGEILNRLGFTRSISVKYLLRSSSKSGKNTVTISPVVYTVLEESDKMCNSEHIDTQHVLLCLTYFKNCSAAKILSVYHIDYDRILSIVEGMDANSIGLPEKKEINKTINNSINIVKSDEERSIPKVSEHGYFLTDRAKQGKLSKIIGREKEIDRILMILSRKKKNNALLIGESGVGKTAIVEGLAQKIISNDVPECLKNKRVFRLDVGSLVSGTKYRGELEEKTEQVIRFVIEEDIILFIDEIHSILSGTGTENGMSVADIIKNALSEEKFRLIGATTIKEYTKFFEKDSAFDRRFMKINVQEPSEEITCEILRGLKEEYEKHYNLSIEDDALVSAVKLSSRYITDRFLPDKAIDVLDETCSKISVFGGKNKVDGTDITKTVEEISGIPVKSDEEEREKFLQLKNHLLKRIIGQNEAIESLSQTMIRFGSGLRDNKKPIGSFIFLGPTGVGKTETAKALSELLFGTEKAMVRFDMTEYMEKNSVNKLIGAPPGYVGYEEGGSLTEKIRNKPYCVVLFDEIEKAHPDVFNVLLQVLDDGRLTDGRGFVVDFRHTIIIMTSNVGAENVVSKNNIVGFGERDKRQDEEEIQISALKGAFRPEFINRIDKIVVFHHLDKDNLRVITNNILERKKMILWEEKGIKIRFEQGVVDFIVEKAYDENYGARPIQRTIESLLDNKLSEMIIRQDLTNSMITVSVSEDQLLLSE